MYAYSNIEYKFQVQEDRMKMEMHNFRKEALERVSSIVAHSSSDIANAIAYAFLDGLSEAEKLADDLNLSKLHFLAIRQDFEAFQEELTVNFDYNPL